MRKTIILVLLSIIGIGVINAQVQLKGKKLQKRIELINTEISNGNFENAIVLFNNPDTIISEKNVSKNEKGIYFTTDSIIKSKIVLFDKNKIKVLDLKKSYDLKKYYEAIPLLNLELDNENSYLETQAIKEKLFDDLEDKKIQCNNIHFRLENWLDLYQKREYDILFEDIFGSNKKEISTNFLSNIDNDKLKDLTKELNDLYTYYGPKSLKNFKAINAFIDGLDLNEFDSNKVYSSIRSLKLLVSNTDVAISQVDGDNKKLKEEFSKLKEENGEKYIAKLNNFVTSVDLRALDYEKSSVLLEKLNLISLKSDSLFSCLTNQSYQTKKEVTIKLLEDKIIELKKIKENNRPLSKNEISQRLMIDKDIPIDFINKNCQSFSSIEIGTLMDVLNLDVYSYYHMWNVDTPLKKQIFEKSEDYKAKLKNINSMKLALESSNFYFENYYTEDNEYYQNRKCRFVIKSNYDLKKGGFVFRFNSTNKNTMIDITYSLPKKTFRCMDEKELFVEFKSQQFPLVLNKFNIDPNPYFDFYEVGEEMFIPIEKSSALEIENNPNNIKVTFITLGKLKSEPWKYEIGRACTFCEKESLYGLVSTEKIRMIVSNIKTGKIYFDKIYGNTSNVKTK